MAQVAERLPSMCEALSSMTLTVNLTVHPLLCRGPYHSREQSTDSGLGLGCYSVPTTPEDFLSNVDEMDTGGSMTGEHSEYCPF
jgi:WW domain-containing transcription regulator protein 1